MARTPGRVLVGASERIDIVDWGIRELPAKIDTGARTSALHVEAVEELPGARVRFEVRLDRADATRRVQVVAPLVRRGRVRAANGSIEWRLFVAARVRIGPVVRRIEIGLVDRKRMLYRMLIGRSALAGRFLVDPGLRFVLARRPARVSGTDLRRAPAQKARSAASA